MRGPDANDVAGVNGEARASRVRNGGGGLMLNCEDEAADMEEAGDLSPDRSSSES